MNREQMKDWSDKAEQFQLKPSAALWKNIEKDLDRHKRKRRFILWFFITGSLLIGGGLMHYYQEQGRAFDAKERIVNASPVEIKSNEVQDQKNVIEGNDELPKVNSSADQKQNSSSNKKLSSISTPNSTSINQKQTTVTNIKKKVASKNQNEITEQLQESNNTVEVNHNSIPKQDTTNTATATISPATAADTATVTTAFTIRSYLAKDGAAPVIDTTATATATTATATTDTATAFTIRSYLAKDGTAPVIDTTATATATDTTAFTIRSYLAKDGTAPVIATTTTTTATSVTIDTTTTATYSMQLGIMPLVSFNRFNEHTDLGSLENYRNNHFKTLMTYATEFRLNMQLNKYLSIGSGFGILTMGEYLKNEQAVYESDTTFPGAASFPMLYDVNTITTIVLLDSGLNTDQYIKTHYTYAQIPVGLTYHLFSRSKFSIGIGATFIYMRLLNASFYEYDFKSNRYIKREKNNQGHLRKNNIAVSGNVAFNYKTGKRFGFCISPSWQYFINSIFDEQYKLNQQHNNFGIKAAVNYFFK